MMMDLTVVNFLSLCFFAFFCVPEVSTEAVYANEWSVEVKGGSEVANRIAASHGFMNFGQIGNLQNHYRFILQKSESVVINKEQEMSMKSLALATEIEVGDVQQQIRRRRVKKKYTVPNDTRWSDQWSLKNVNGTDGPSGLDLNVEKAWLQNVDGSGVLVGVVDCGVQWNHSDIRKNFNFDVSYNFVTNTRDPSPNISEIEAGHGTSCAGEIAMVKNNECGVGVAYESEVAGLRIGLSEGLTDSEEADALGHMDDKIKIYSNSWGPADTGCVVDGPGPLVVSTFQNGVKKGRNGKGSIHVWASGNGGWSYDSCAADGYASSIYTIAVGSADQKGEQAGYDEDCAAKMAVTYSFNSDDFGEDGVFDQITTIDLSEGCIDSFTGTSASAPLLSGTLALVLQKNPELSWRDVQYLVVYTSDPTKLLGQSFIRNGAGLKVSSQFGFGAIDAEAMVTRASHWINVPEQQHETFEETVNGQTGKNGSSHQIEVTPLDTQITFLEHVVLTMNIEVKGDTNSWDPCDYDVNPCDYMYDEYSSRGDIRIHLESPSGTESVLLPNRICDVSPKGYSNWPFMSVQFWGENPIGIWTVTVYFDDDEGYAEISGKQSFELYGTEVIPESVKRIPDKCDVSCVRGCAAAGKKYCDSCKKYRNPNTLECLDTCKTSYNGYCLDYGSSNSAHGRLSLVIILVPTIGGVILLIALMLIIIYIFVKIRTKSRHRGYQELTQTPAVNT